MKWVSLILLATSLLFVGREETLRPRSKCLSQELCDVTLFRFVCWRSVLIFDFNGDMAAVRCVERSLELCSGNIARINVVVCH
jgi:hypothetical protein